MDLKPYLASLIKILEIIAGKTASTIDDSILSLLKALQDSPALLDFLASLLKRTENIPSGALAQVDASDPELASAFNASPAVKKWAAMQAKPAAPSSAEPFAIGSVLVLLKYLPTLLTLFKAAKDAGLFVKDQK